MPDNDLSFTNFQSLSLLILYFSATNTQGKSVYFIHSSEYPRSTFTVLDPSYTCLVADNTLDSIFAHLKPFYTPRKGLRIESRGYRHEVKEKYVVKFASVTFSATSKAVIVEVCMINNSSLIISLMLIIMNNSLNTKGHSRGKVCSHSRCPQN